jgi:hypothetical protein
MDTAVAGMAAMQAQTQMQAMQTMGMNMALAADTHMQNMAQTATQAIQGQNNQLQQFSSSIVADGLSQLKSSQQSLSQAASA